MKSKALFGLANFVAEAEVALLVIAALVGLVGPLHVAYLLVHIAALLAGLVLNTRDLHRADRNECGDLPGSAA